MRRISSSFLGLGLAAALASCPGAARADAIAVTYSGAGVQVPDFASVCTATATNTCIYGAENFSNWTGANNYAASFTGGGNDFTASQYFTGTYSASDATFSANYWRKVNANQYGGANGTSPYPAIFSTAGVTSSYTLNIAAHGVPGANYFGVWISALDAANNLTLTTSTGQVYNFTPTQLITALGSCSGGSNLYCGNPTTPFKGQNSGEQYVYVNFFDTNGFFTSVTWSNSSSSGFESSNHALAYFDPNVPFGTPIPEPAALGLFGIGLLSLAAARRRTAV